MTWRDITTLTLDTETTSRYPEHARVIQIGAMLTRPGRDASIKESWCNPGCEVPNEVVEAIHLTPQELEAVRTALPFSEYAPGLASSIQRRGLITGYNILHYDLTVLNAEFQRAGIMIKHSPPILDVMVWARHLVPADACESHQLAEVARALDIHITGQAHRAGADCEMTWLILDRMAPQMPHDLSALLDAQDFYAGFGSFIQWRESGPVLNCNSKKAAEPYRGRPLKEVYTRDPGFVEWFLRRIPAHNVEALRPWL